MKIIYVMGVGRSGSTVLDTVLSNHPQMEGVGELSRLMRYGILNQEYCACGQRGNECPFWSEVVREWKHQLPTAQVHEYVALQDRYEALKHWLLPARMQRNRCAQFNRYIQETHALFSAISDVSGKDVIVDSSKLRGRVLALAKVPDVELYVVHLVRDVRGVAWSLKKSFTKQEEQGIPRQIKALPVWRAAAQWCLVNLQSEWVKRQLPQERSLCIRYEDFVTDPKATLQRIGEFAGCNLWELGDAVMAGATMNVHHTIAGNRLRMAGRVKLRADEEWRCKLSRQEQWSISGVAGWMMRRYGYR